MGGDVLMLRACAWSHGSVAEFNFRFSARHLVITARASAAQSSSCLLTQSDGANSKFRELPHSRRLYRNFNKSPALLATIRIYIRTPLAR